MVRVAASAPWEGLAFAATPDLMPLVEAEVLARAVARYEPSDAATRLLAERFPGASVAGIDSSRHFVALARQAPIARAHFEVADVTQPLPGGPYDVIYCRYLLTHLARPMAAIDNWSAHLRPGGVLAIEENDWIRTVQPAFARYLEIVEAMLADAGQKLYVGAELERADDWPQLVKVSSDVVPVTVEDRAAAGMFVPNLATWRNRPYVVENTSAGELDRLHHDLEDLAHDSSGQRSITFGQRRLVFRRK